MARRYFSFVTPWLLLALASACDAPCPAGTMREPSGRCVVSSADGSVPRPDGGTPRLDGCSPRAERCDGLADDDCDGIVDNGCECVDGTTAPCGTDDGECVTGVVTCASGAWPDDCDGAIGPGVEICNGLDDDCDGEVDGPSAWASCGSAPGATDLRCALTFDAEESCRVAACDEGLEDCDLRAATGCEVDVLSDSANCGSCARACTRSSACETGSCQPLPRNGWSTNVAGSSDDVGLAVAIDAAGNVYAAGRFEGTLRHGTTTLPDASATGGFVASWTADGAPRWLDGIGGPGEQA
ncbi:MAG: hypothetical protein M3Q72_14560, partial [Actinomycetota bacterium]|nr:hypothetical protein [Myxococcota bacterium]MDQ3178740.1 hypothetical protein [Actinomycetota bacterium]